MGDDQITIQDHTTRQVESFMAKNTRFQQKKEPKISAIQPTDDQLTGRARFGSLCGLSATPWVVAGSGADVRLDAQKQQGNSCWLKKHRPAVVELGLDSMVAFIRSRWTGGDILSTLCSVVTATIQTLEEV